MSQTESVILFLNQKAAKSEPLAQAVEANEGSEVLSCFCPLGSEGFAKGVQYARSQSIKRFIAAGGDGTLNGVVNAVMSELGEEESLAVVPMGTGNDFSRYFSVPTDPAEALASALQTSYKTIDLGYALGRCFVNSLSIGIGAEATASAPELAKVGLKEGAYAVQGVVKLIQEEPLKMKISSDNGLVWEGQALGVSIGNGRYAGGGFAVCPEAKVDDGKLDLTVFAGETKAETLLSMTQFFVSEDFKALPRFQSSQFTIKLDRPTKVNIDGEEFTEQEVSVTCRPSQLKWVAPS